MSKLKNQIHDVLVRSGYTCSWGCEKRHFFDVWNYVYVHKDDTLPTIYFNEGMDFIYVDIPKHELDGAKAEQVISYFNEYNTAHKKQDAVHVQSEYVNKWLSLASFINEEGTWIDKINQVLLANGFKRINGLPFTVSGLPSWDYIYYHELVNLYIYFNNYTKVGSAAVPYCIHAKYGDGSFHQLDNKSPEELLAYFQASITAPQQYAVNPVQQDSKCDTMLYGMSYMRKLQTYYHELIGALDSGDLAMADAAHGKLKQLLNDSAV